MKFGRSIALIINLSKIITFVISICESKAIGNGGNNVDCRSNMIGNFEYI